MGAMTLHSRNNAYLVKCVDDHEYPVDTGHQYYIGIYQRRPWRKINVLIQWRSVCLDASVESDSQCLYAAHADVGTGGGGRYRCLACCPSAPVLRSVHLISFISTHEFVL